MPKRQAKRARLARKAGGDVIAETKKDLSTAPKSTPTPVKMTRLQSLLIDLPKLNIPLPPPTTFTVFPELPPELRNKIWKFAAMVPRDINLRARNYAAGRNDQPETPAILLTCSEARKEGKRYYTLCRENKEIRRYHYPTFSQRDTRLDPRLRSATRICQKNKVWINFAVDRFTYLVPSWIYGELSLPPMDVEGAFCFEDDVLNRIQHLALRHELGWFDSSVLNGCPEVFVYLQNLLVKNSLKDLLLMGTECISARSRESPVILDRDWQQVQEKFAVKLWKEQKRAGWKLPVTIALHIRYLCCFDSYWL